MTRARVLAQQATRPPKGARLLRGTVSVVSPLTVQIAGGTAVAGIPLPGAVYTVGGAVLVLVQEPGIGPVYPIPGTTAIPSTTGSIAYAGTAADFGTTRRSVLTRTGQSVTLAVQLTVGATPPAAGATIATLPTGFRPDYPADALMTLYTGGWNNQTAAVEVTPTGTLIVNSSTVALAANQGILGSLTFPAAAGT